MDKDTFLTLAEIAVAFAGFAGIASALGRQNSSIDPRVNGLRLHNMVDFSLAVVTLSLIPPTFDQLMAADPMLWRVASGVALVFVLGLAIRVTNRNRQVEHLPDYDTAGATRLKILAAMATLFLLAGLTGLADRYAQFLYLVAALIALAMCGILFMRIIGSLAFRGRDADPQ